MTTEEIMKARKHIHAILDPLWKSGKYKRSELYRIIGNKLKCNYHTAMIKSDEEAREVYRIVKGLQ